MRRNANLLKISKKWVSKIEASYFGKLRINALKSFGKMQKAALIFCFAYQHLLINH